MKICINCHTISCCCTVIILTLQIYVISSEYILIRFQILTKHSEWVRITVNQFIWHSLQIKCATDTGWPLVRCERQVLWVLARMHCIGVFSWVGAVEREAFNRGAPALGPQCGATTVLICGRLSGHSRFRVCIQTNYGSISFAVTGQNTCMCI